MKKIFFLLIAFTGISLLSCSDEDPIIEEYPKTVNIKFEITTTRNTAAIIDRTFNNDTQTDEVEDLPYSFTYAQQEVNRGSYFKLNYKENGDYPSEPGSSSWTDYDATLKILVDDEVVKNETFMIQIGTGIVEVDYTFN